MNLKIFAGRSNEPLAQGIVSHLSGAKFELEIGKGFELGVIDERRRTFNDGELYTRYGENLRGCDVFIVHS